MKKEKKELNIEKINESEYLFDTLKNNNGNRLTVGQLKEILGKFENDNIPISISLFYKEKNEARNIDAHYIIWDPKEFLVFESICLDNEEDVYENSYLDNNIKWN